MGDPSVPLLIVEGIKKGDAAASRGACVVVVSGVDNWRGKNARGGKTALADWEHVALNGRLVRIAYDSDTWRNRHIRARIAEADGVPRIAGCEGRMDRPP